jgi:hypothetical protein
MSSMRVRLGLDGCTAHAAATRELDALTKEVGRIVRAMDARNRQRFRNDRQALEQWISARTVLEPPPMVTTVGGGWLLSGGSVASAPRVPGGRPLQRRDIDLLHLEHRIHDPPRSWHAQLVAPMGHPRGPARRHPFPLGDGLLNSELHVAEGGLELGEKWLEG